VSPPPPCPCPCLCACRQRRSPAPARRPPSRPASQLAFVLILSSSNSFKKHTIHPWRRRGGLCTPPGRWWWWHRRTLYEKFTTDDDVHTDYNAQGQQPAGDVCRSSSTSSPAVPFRSRQKYLCGEFNIQVNLVPDNSAGTVTSFYASSVPWLRLIL
jgi:hypothetical protein